MKDRLELARSLHALARTGLHFCHNEYDRQRYEQIEDIAATLLAGPAAEDQATVRSLWAAESGYVTPKVEVRGAVFDTGGCVLLVRERAEQHWTLPGGWAEVNDSPSAAIEKEVEQESGYRVRAVKLAALLDRRMHGHGPSLFHCWKAYFLCEMRGGEARASYETDAVGFFALDALPPMSLPRSTPGQVHRMYEHWLRRDRPTDFD